VSASDECYTPAEWIDRARIALGRIDCDPCSSVEAQKVVKAIRFHTEATDGLRARIRWSGRVWLNPPYSDPSPWVAKLIAEYESGRCRAAVALLNARTGSGWFQALSRIAWRCEKRKRIRFYGPATTGRSGFVDQVFFYLGDEPDRFRSAFHQVGVFVPPLVTPKLAPSNTSQSVTQTVTDDGARGCVVCARPLDGFHRQAVVCSNRCRQRRYRDRMLGARV